MSLSADERLDLAIERIVALANQVTVVQQLADQDHARHFQQQLVAAQRIEELEGDVDRLTRICKAHHIDPANGQKKRGAA